ncbi:MAG: Rne/Rng family ribonuclease [Rhodospirillales bacterium]|nr:Rne/Rng family ribonuclease [Rhodospirillales bacterium]
MTKKMLIDATHSEETRVAVVDDKRLIEYDYESQVRKQLKGSIFLAKVTRVEPSLQAAFVNFGGNRHGFLPFSEIHPDYFRIPIADREALIAEQQAAMEAMEAAEAEAEAAEEAAMKNEDSETSDHDDDLPELEEVGGRDNDDASERGDNDDNNADDDTDNDEADDSAAAESEGKGEGDETDDNQRRDQGRRGRRGRNNYRGRGRGRHRMAADSRRVEVVGGDNVEGDRPLRPSLKKHYKIQEVVKRGQIMLIQVSKEERGNKGAAVTTYLSLPGRYCVLMPNSPRGGGVSRKIANYKDRKRMRDVLSDLQIPDGMSVIMRTAGVERTKPEIKRDLDYLTRLWNDIRELTLKSTAPALVHEEGHLVRRSIRDIYTRDIEEVLVAGEDGFETARNFMKMMIPSHAKRVVKYEDDKFPLFHRYQVENQIAGMNSPEATLKSGGYLIINQTEALVAVDVNSGRATKERHIEETALKTNLEAADEVARQLRLRDLGGLVVIDFIDMEDRRNNRKVEQRLKEALSTDRARIQIGRISSFGLMELSRQRLNPSLNESQYQRCPHCEGTGTVPTVDSAAIMALRSLEDEGIKARASQVALFIPNEVALYILNNKRDILGDIEQRYGFSVLIKVDDTLSAKSSRIEMIRAIGKGGDDEDEEDSDTSSSAGSSAPATPAAADDEQDDGQNRKSNRRRGRRGGRRRNNNPGNDAPQNEESDGNETSEKTESTAEPKEEKPKARDHKPSKNTDKEDSVKAAAETPAEKAATDKTDDTAQGKEKKPAAKGRKPSSRAKKADTVEVTEEKAEKAEESKPVKKAAAPRKSAKKSEPSNDSAPPAPKEYETVNQAPDKKKKGWWNKLVE